MYRSGAIKFTQRSPGVRLGFTAGLAMLFLAALLWGMAGAPLAHADPGSLFVDRATGSDDSDCTNPLAPCATIRYALMQAGNGDEILVAQGIYTDDLDIQITVTLKGGYAISGTAWLPRGGETVVDVSETADQPAIAIYPHTSVTVEGFVVQGANSTEGGGIMVDRGTAVISDTVIRDNSAASGGGIYVEKWPGFPGSLTLVNSSLLSNTATSEGGGGLFSTGWPTVTLENVEVRGNHAGDRGGGLRVGRVTIADSWIVNNTSVNGGGGIEALLAEITNSQIVGNEANGPGDVNGGGINITVVGLHLQDSVVSNNRAVGLAHSGISGVVVGDGQITIINSRISGNTNGSNAISVWNSTFAITNSQITDNDGSGIVGDERPVTGTLVNVTVSGNGANGLRMNGAEVSLLNSIVWGNGADDNRCGGTCTISYSDIGTGISPTGPGNISSDPSFVDVAKGNYRLRTGSPCIDAGTSSGAPADDITGSPRDGTPDMGAYEWRGVRVFLALMVRSWGP